MYDIFMETTHNPNCPDYWSHHQNAEDRLFPGTYLLNGEQSQLVDQAAEIEYMACEGH